MSKYCKECGKIPEHYANQTGYSESTGEPVYSLWTHCCNSYRSYKHGVSKQEADVWYPPKPQSRSFIENLLDILAGVGK